MTDPDPLATWHESLRLIDAHIEEFTWRYTHPTQGRQAVYTRFVRYHLGDPVRYELATVRGFTWSIIARVHVPCHNYTSTPSILWIPTEDNRAAVTSLGPSHPGLMAGVAQGFAHSADLLITGDGNPVAVNAGNHRAGQRSDRRAGRPQDDVLTDWTAIDRGRP